MTKSNLSTFDILTSRILHSERMADSIFRIFVKQVLLVYRMPHLGYKQILMNKNVIFITIPSSQEYICMN